MKIMNNFEEAKFLSKQKGFGYTNMEDLKKALNSSDDKMEKAWKHHNKCMQIIKSWGIETHNEPQIGEKIIPLKDQKIYYD